MGFQERGPHTLLFLVLKCSMMKRRCLQWTLASRAELPVSSAGGSHSGLKPTGSGPAVAIAAAATAVVSVDPEGLGGPPPSRTQPCHVLTLAPIRIPLRTAPFPGKYPARLSEPRAGESPQHGSPGGGLLASRPMVSWVLVRGALGSNSRVCSSADHAHGPPSH